MAAQTGRARESVGDREQGRPRPGRPLSRAGQQRRGTPVDGLGGPPPAGPLAVARCRSPDRRRRPGRAGPGRAGPAPRARRSRRRAAGRPARRGASSPRAIAPGHRHRAPGLLPPGLEHRHAGGLCPVGLRHRRRLRSPRPRATPPPGPARRGPGPRRPGWWRARRTRRGWPERAVAVGRAAARVRPEDDVAGAEPEVPGAGLVGEFVGHDRVDAGQVPESASRVPRASSMASCRYGMSARQFAGLRLHPVDRRGAGPVPPRTASAWAIVDRAIPGRDLAAGRSSTDRPSRSAASTSRPCNRMIASKARTRAWCPGSVRVCPAAATMSTVDCSLSPQY